MVDSNFLISSDIKDIDTSLNDLLLDPVSSFVGKASGDSMQGVGIFDGDILIIDRKLKPKHNDVIVASYNGLFVCKIADMINNQLCSANPSFPPVKVKDLDEYIFQGVVTSSIHLFKPYL
ncbi:LexA family protein [Pseudoalteromonas sp. 68 DY56-GL68]|uniref:LexA family protein n=1 Tax=Pseudoalteromonas sp. 68 DY56-GL68 TaxID=2974919 RepID=UPI00352B7827